MRVLLTGANGFVGGHLYTLLKSKGHEVRALTRIADARYGNDNIACDLERKENLDHLLEVLADMLGQRLVTLEEVEVLHWE